MSREDVERALSVYEGRTPEAFFALLADDIEIDNAAYPLPDYPGTVRGREAALEFYRRYWGAFDPGSYDLEAEEVREVGDRIVIVNRERGAGRASGAPVDRTLVAVWTFEGDKLRRLALFRTLDEALAALEAGR